MSLLMIYSIRMAGGLSNNIPEVTSHHVGRLTGSMTIDGDWNKVQWQQVGAINISENMGETPKFKPTTKVKMLYDDSNVYIIFRVQDRYVRSVIQEYNEPVSHDSCVEFFFSTDASFPERYFNLEVNSGGVALMGYHINKRTNYELLSPLDLERIEIAHSLPKITEPEITEPITWTVEYKISFSILKKFTHVNRPEPGVTWRANFYKTASKTSNPHYISWATAENETPDFHLPEFFGVLQFV